MSPNCPAIYRVRNRSSSVASQGEQKEQGRDNTDMNKRSSSLDPETTILQRYDEILNKCVESIERKQMMIHAQQSNSDTKDVQKLKDFFYFFNQKTRNLAFKNTASQSQTIDDESTTQQSKKDVQEKANKVWDAVHQDFLALKSAMEAAELDLVTRLAETPKNKRPRLESVQIDTDLGCKESVPWSETLTSANQQEQVSSLSSQDRQARLLRLAQETAAIREAAKIMRKRARELAQTRALTREEISSLRGN
jgi:hypothetical protein